ncbi:hypothetical protein GLOIN_2v1849317 [Rhizophagus clarus]|uniref:Uncharacterized protein n=1 Tax=Rhizophagus clarus TaxID=94130 RepID=A0A8H3M297_9GLOM|nr:hypothetical protein GLOIN_2v1849317 [Rhizophagus clarus]GES89397.1 hypothetical protein GLOIN_2v1849317 [Rhizophagus clarus]GES96286.1 hypothetical protein GLOIN_2v1849317 [Rhizophagus clarus]
MDSLSLIRIPKIHLPSPILPFNFDSGEQPDKPEPSVPIIPPSGSPSGGVSETFSNNGTNKKLNINNEFSDNDDRNEKQGHDQASRDIEENSNKNHVGESNDDQVKVLDTNTDDANEDFYTSMRKRAKPDEKILLAINKIGGPAIDLLLYSLSKLKKTGVKSVTMNLVNNNIQFVDSTGTLMIKPNHVNSDDITINANFPHYDYNQTSDLNFGAKFIELKKSKKLDMASIRLAEDLHKLLDYIGKLPNNPPIRDRSIFSKKEKYREALISHLEKINSTKDFQFFRGTQRINLIPDDNQKKIPDENQKKIPAENQKNRRSFKISPIRVQEKTSSLTELSDEFKKIAKDLSEDIFLCVMGEANEQGNKEMARRRELRFHVEFFRSYIQLQAFCEINLNRKQSETTKSQAKILISHFYPLISLPNMELMLQRAPRIYRLLEVANFDWRLLDCFEELTACFFKSGKETGKTRGLKLKLLRNILIFQGLILTR